MPYVKRAVITPEHVRIPPEEIIVGDTVQQSRIGGAPNPPYAVVAAAEVPVAPRHGRQQTRRLGKGEPVRGENVVVGVGRHFQKPDAPPFRQRGIRPPGHPPVNAVRAVDDEKLVLRTRIVGNG